jgi:asparagine N-glycosylation enzyme membrane subunit Stt3
MEKKEIAKYFESAKDFFSQRKNQNIIIGILFVVLLFFSISIRTSNWDLLTDQTTGEKIPLALDPFYFLRMGQTILENNELPEFDDLKYIPNKNVGWSGEIHPQITVVLFKISSLFSNSLDFNSFYIASPVFYYSLGIIAFFFLALFLFKSKLFALLVSSFLMFTPAYLYRTTAGFCDHESIGMMAFFAVMLILVYSLKKIEALEKIKIKESIFFGLLLSFFTALTIGIWAGVANFLFMIIPLAVFLIWLIIVKKDSTQPLNYLIFYFTWFFTFPFITILIANGFSFGGILNNYYLSTTSLLTPFVFGFILIDFLSKKYNFAKKLNFKYPSIILSFAILIFFGFLFYLIFLGNPLSLFSKVATKIIYPFTDPTGTGRLGITVAEGKISYLNELIVQFTKPLFWMFFGGLIYLGMNLTKLIKTNKKQKSYFFLAWLFLIFGLLFSRYSGSSVFNGENFISKTFIYLSLLVFLYISIKIYLSSEIKLDSNLIVLSIVLLLMAFISKGAVRFIFVVAPFILLGSGYFLLNLFNSYKSSKDESIRLLFLVAFIVLLGVAFYYIFLFYQTSSAQALYLSPSANVQWQQAMSWTRENTSKDALFTHWWDYGYWIQSLGHRKTTGDGGHFQGADIGNHRVGRYVLTTPYPESALSFAKTYNVSYLLIDPTDLGKYSAYSSIGNGKNLSDRFSTIPVLVNDESQTTETKEQISYLFAGQTPVDEDIMFKQDDTTIFLPKDKSFLIGVGVILENNQAGNTFSKAIGFYYYNGKQYQIPLKYIYFNERIIEFDEGITAVVRIIPSFSNNRLNPLGAAVYLSPKTYLSLFSQLYLLDDVFGNYPTITLAHQQDDMVVEQLNSMGANLQDFIY